MAEYMNEHKDEEFTGIILDIDKNKIFIKLDNNVKCLLERDGEFAKEFSIDNIKKVLLGRYSKEKIKLGTRVLVKVTNVDIPQKEVYVDVKEIIRDYDNSKGYVKKLDRNKQ